MGDAEAIKILKEHYATEKDALLRGFIVSAMRQIFFRHKETKQQIVDFIYVKMGLMVKCTPERGQKCSLFHTFAGVYNAIMENHHKKSARNAVLMM